MKPPRGGRKILLAWIAAITAYAGLWAYHAAAYGLWYHGPVSPWLRIGLSVSLAAALALTVAYWLRARKKARR